MLSYRHAFHAGNHADVLKHLTLIEVLDYFNRKPAPYWYVDTHAGAGCYATEGKMADKLGEIHGGVGALVSWAAAPDPVRRFLTVVGCQDRLGATYPGSPMIAAGLMRPEDGLRLFELHPADFERLETQFAGQGRRVQVRRSDGFAALKALLPPAPRRAVVLIDPPYEVKGDYDTVLQALDQGLRRFASGCYLIWYPVLGREDSRVLPERLRKRVDGHFSWLDARLHVASTAPSGLGMNGSGMFVVNPPYLLRERLAQALPALAERLATGPGARHELDGRQL